MARVVTRIGDVFRVTLDDSTCRYFQNIAKDRTQLNSNVIRAFQEVYPADAEPDLMEVVRGEVEFYAHCMVRWGVDLELWEKVGHVSEVGPLDILFRSTLDYIRKLGQERVKVSHNWRVWRINEPWREVTRLQGPEREAEIGLVMSPKDIVHRLRTGAYKIEYPGFE